MADDSNKDNPNPAGTLASAESSAGDRLLPHPGHFPPETPWLLRPSGLYTGEGAGAAPTAFAPPKASPVPLDPKLSPTRGAHAGAVPPAATAPGDDRREELRLDVDGLYPQMTASGTIRDGFRARLNWIARLTPAGHNAWAGEIWYKDGDSTLLPQSEVTIQAVTSFFAHQRKATVTFAGGGGPTRTRELPYASAYFRPVEFEYDHEAGVAPVLAYDPAAHPNRPATLPAGELSIETVFHRAGFDARRNAAATAIAHDGPDPDSTWSDAEMHDAMQSYWSRFADAPQWALWVLFARQHDWGPFLGGLMFDKIGPNERQGTAVFTDSFLAEPPESDPAPAAWTRRMTFWAAVHEMGHAFNLAHSWQKHGGTPWTGLSPNPEARSFMNYPQEVEGGQRAFFADFAFRFSDPELLFLRHAPKRFVQQGNATWYDDHGFLGAAVNPEPGFALELRVDRAPPVFEFLEPVVLELKLSNVSGAPKLIPADVLQHGEDMTVVVKRDGQPARQWRPFAHYCSRAETVVLDKGASRTESLFVGAGRDGWALAEPGLYTVQVALTLDGEDVVSAPLRLRVTPPRDFEAELVAQDVFTDDAGRVMALDGSRVMEAGNNAWRELLARLPDSRAAIHARVCLALPDKRNYRVLRIDAAGQAVALDGRAARAAFAVQPKNPDSARAELDKALLDDPEAAAVTLGREDYTYYAANYAAWLKANGDAKAAKTVADKAKKAAKRAMA